jgi:HEPN domain-containing protein
MASPLDQAHLLLKKAEDDWAAVQVLIESRMIADEIVGFHAQQVIEKALKAVLSKKSITFRRTHDLIELMDLLEDNGVQIPLELEKTDVLTPYAVEFRYDILPPENVNSGRMNQSEIREIVQKALEWAKLLI